MLLKTIPIPFHLFRAKSIESLPRSFLISVLPCILSLFSYFCRAIDYITHRYPSNHFINGGCGLRFSDVTCMAAPKISISLARFLSPYTTFRVIHRKPAVSTIKQLAITFNFFGGILSDWSTFNPQDLLRDSIQIAKKHLELMIRV